jgi:hypothetical protein
MKNSILISFLLFQGLFSISPETFVYDKQACFSVESQNLKVEQAEGRILMKQRIDSGTNTAKLIFYFRNENDLKLFRKPWLEGKSHGRDFSPWDKNIFNYTESWESTQSDLSFPFQIPAGYLTFELLKNAGWYGNFVDYNFCHEDYCVNIEEHLLYTRNMMLDLFKFNNSKKIIYIRTLHSDWRDAGGYKKYFHRVYESILISKNKPYRFLLVYINSYNFKNGYQEMRLENVYHPEARQWFETFRELDNCNGVNK